MSANAMQVGGSHYQGEYQHWDWVSDCDIHYLLGCATKYVVRWRKKNGLQDLEKSRHYFIKMKELLVEGRLVKNNFDPLGEYRARQRRALTEMFIRDNMIDPKEAEYIYICALHSNVEELCVAERAIDDLIALARVEKSLA